STSGSTTTTPNTHLVTFVGSIPCNDHGRELNTIINQRGVFPVDGTLTASCMFSSKPTGGYPDYYEKMTSYVDMLLGHARAIDPSVTAKMFPPTPTDESESVIRYVDSASSLAQISAISGKLTLGKVRINVPVGTGES